jgi:hypothetical protein
MKEPRMSRTLLPAVLALLPLTVQAQTIGSCDDWRTSAALLAEPWEANTRTFAEGAVRLALIDTYEPAAGAFHLLILSPPYDELGFSQCALVSNAEGAGFAGLDVSATEAAYDPATGLTFTIPATRWIMESDSYVPAVLTVTLNQATGAIAAVLD